MLLDEVLANAAERANMLKMEGQEKQAISIENVISEVKKADDMRQYLDWLDEEDAALYTGRQKSTLARHFAAMEKRHLARWHNGRRQYRRQALPHRGNAEAARRSGAEAAHA